MKTNTTITTTTSILLLNLCQVFAEPPLKLTADKKEAIVGEPIKIDGGLNAPPNGAWVRFKATLGRCDPEENKVGSTTTFTPTQDGTATITAELIGRDGKSLSLDPAKITLVVKPRGAPGANPPNLENVNDPGFLTDFSEAMGGMRGAFFDPGEAEAGVEVIANEAAGGRAGVLAVTYDVTNPDAFCGVWLKGKRFQELASFGKRWKTLSVMMRGDQERGFPKNFKIEVKSREFGWRICYLKNIRTDINGQWQTFEFPASKFTRVGAWDNDANEIAFTFENKVVDRDRRRGALYIDDVRLLER